MSKEKRVSDSVKAIIVKYIHWMTESKEFECFQIIDSKILAHLEYLPLKEWEGMILTDDIMDEMDEATVVFNFRYWDESKEFYMDLLSNIFKHFGMDKKVDMVEFPKFIMRLVSMKSGSIPSCCYELLAKNNKSLLQMCKDMIALYQSQKKPEVIVVSKKKKKRSKQQLHKSRASSSSIEAKSDESIDGDEVFQVETENNQLDELKSSKKELPILEYLESKEQEITNSNTEQIEEFHSMEQSSDHLHNSMITNKEAYTNEISAEEIIQFQDNIRADSERRTEVKLQIIKENGGDENLAFNSMVHALKSQESKLYSNMILKIVETNVVEPKNWLLNYLHEKMERSSEQETTTDLIANTFLVQNYLLDKLINVMEEYKKSVDDNKRFAEDNKKFVEENKKLVEEYKKSVDDNKRFAEDNKKFVEDNKKLVEDNQKSAEDNRKFAEDNRKFAEDNKKLVEDNQKSAEDNKKLAEEYKKSVEDNKKLAEDNQKSAEDNKNLAEEYKKSVEDNKKLAEDNKKFVEENKKLVEEYKKSAEDNRKFAEEYKKYVEEHVKKNPHTNNTEERLKCSCDCASCLSCSKKH